MIYVVTGNVKDPILHLHTSASKKTQELICISDFKNIPIKIDNLLELQKNLNLENDLLVIQKSLEPILPEILIPYTEIPDVHYKRYLLNYFILITEVIRDWIYENKDFNLRADVSTGSYGVVRCIIHYPKIWVKNEQDNEYPIYDFFSLITFARCDELYRKFSFTNQSLKTSHYVLDEGLVHPHSTSYFGSGFNSMCLGSNTQISKMQLMQIEVDEFEIYGVLTVVDSYLKNESLTGGPHRKSTLNLNFQTERQNSSNDVSVFMNNIDFLKSITFSFDSQMNPVVSSIGYNLPSENRDYNGRQLNYKSTLSMIPKEEHFLGRSNVEFYGQNVYLKSVPISNEDFQRMVKSYFKYENNNFRTSLINKINQDVKNAIQYTKISDSRFVAE